MTELIIVIGIIAVLLSIIFPVVSAARDSARTVQCSANLYAIGQAFGAFRVNNGGNMPPAIAARPGLRPPSDALISRFDYGVNNPGEAPKTWADFLIDTGGLKPENLRCPSAMPFAFVGPGKNIQTENPIDYSMNAHIHFQPGRLFGDRREPDPVNGGAWQPTADPQTSIYKNWPYTRITKPAEGMLVVDGPAPQRTVQTAQAYVYSKEPGYAPRELRHTRKRKINLLFFDGHVEAREPALASVSERDVIFDNSDYAPTGGGGKVYLGTPSSIGGGQYELSNCSQPTPLWRPWKPYF